MVTDNTKKTVRGKDDGRVRINPRVKAETQALIHLAPINVQGTLIDLAIQRLFADKSSRAILNVLIGKSVIDQQVYKQWLAESTAVSVPAEQQVNATPLPVDKVVEPVKEKPAPAERRATTTQAPVAPQGQTMDLSGFEG